MLSSTAGYTRRSRVLGQRRDETSLRTVLCPALRRSNRCRAHQREEQLRATLAAEHEQQLIRTATEMHTLQCELLPDATPTLDSIIAELRRTPPYVQWSLDATTAERMAELRWRRCPYSHQRDIHAILRQQRRMDAKTGKQQEKEKQQLLGGRRKGFAAAEARRRRVFNGLTPLQKCVVCLMWQRSFHIPQKVVCDVRRRMEEDLLENEESESEVNARVEAEEQQLVYVTVCRPTLGVVDLSSIPHIVAYISQHPEETVILPETLAHFIGSGTNNNNNNSNNSNNRHHHHHNKNNHKPNKKTSSSDNSGNGIIPCLLTEKQVDISTTACAHELVEAILWTLKLINEENMQKGENSHHNKVVLRSLTLRRCDMTSADALVGALRKQRQETTLLSLDLGDNRLMNLRFLFALRAHFSERLLRLSLEGNPITRKPDYREQVRMSLPKLTSLDGKAIRRPPLSMPYPTILSDTFRLATNTNTSGTKTSSGNNNNNNNNNVVDATSRRVLSGEELDAVMDNLARFLYIWETRRVPWTVAEVEKELQQQRRLALKRQKTETQIKSKEEKEDEFTLPPEEELDEDNFHHRYLHPSAMFTMTLHDELSFFNPETMQLATEVEFDNSYTGMRLSPVDVRDLRVFDVAMKGNSRNLLLGRSVLHRFARGSLNCYTAYKYSIYPQQLQVCHHLGGAVVSISKITDTTMKNAATKPVASKESEHQNEQNKQKENAKQKQGSKKKRMEMESSSSSSPSAAFSSSMYARKPTFYTVTIHGVMSWRSPSMKRGECILAAYDRVVTFVDNALPPTSALERRRGAPLLVFNDHIYLRPARTRDSVCYMAHSHECVARLVVEFGLEACGVDGVGLVRAVAERANSDAAAHATLRLLVFGLNTVDAEMREACEKILQGEEEGEKRQEESEEDEQAQTENDDKEDEDECSNTADRRYFDILSLISSDCTAVVGNGNSSNNDHNTKDSLVETIPHRVTLAQVDRAVALMNTRYTAAFTSNSKRTDRKEEEVEKKRKG
ncbi:hypothetical protein LSM04_007520 [Trypanosoma melophagium]|uniref:uncharacterized protein n=1 Tax=Trypanosoma melophagium TaxID=715481 RepID=UPI00351A9D28|nr:hypothetical protein LSM04_007520 [Trypanosoma melophagium]